MVPYGSMGLGAMGSGSQNSFGARTDSQGARTDSQGARTDSASGKTHEEKSTEGGKTEVDP